MSVILNLIQNLAQDARLSSHSKAKEKVQIIQGLITLGFLCLFLGGVFILYGFHQYLVIHYGSYIASMIIGLILLTLSAIIGAAIYFYKRYRSKYMHNLSREIPIKIHDALLSLDREFEAIIKEYPKTSVLMASIVGFCAENKL